MTSRLKRKLGDIGVDSSSSKANESFCLVSWSEATDRLSSLTHIDSGCQIGTPLPPLEKSRDTGEFVPLWKQDVGIICVSRL